MSEKSEKNYKCDCDWNAQCENCKTNEKIEAQVEVEEITSNLVTSLFSNLSLTSKSKILDILLEDFVEKSLTGDEIVRLPVIISKITHGGLLPNPSIIALGKYIINNLHIFPDDIRPNKNKKVEIMKVTGFDTNTMKPKRETIRVIYYEKKHIPTLIYLCKKWLGDGNTTLLTYQ